MSFFRRRSEKHKSADSSKISSSSGLSRSSSLKNERSSNSVLPPSKLWKNNNDADLGQSTRNGSIGGQQRPHTLLLSNEDLKQKSAPLPESLESPVRTMSRLSKTLQEIIRDKDGLSCFIEFMKSEKAEHLIKFWCDAESFHAATFMRLRSHALQSVSKSALLKRRSKSNSESTSEDTGMTEGRSKSKSESISGNTVITDIHHIQTNAEDFSVKSSNSNCDRRDDTKDGLLTQGQDESSHTLTSGTSLSTDDESFHPHSSRLSNLPNDETFHQNAKSKSSKDSHSTISEHPSSTSANPTSYSSSLTSQNQNSTKHCSESSERDRSFLCDTDTSDTGNERSAILKGQNSKQPLSPSMIPSEHHPNSLGGIEETSSIGRQTACNTSNEDDNNPHTLESKQSNNETEDLATKLMKSIERDAVTIFSTYIAKDAPKLIGVGDELRADAISKICREDGQVDPMCFTECQEFVLKKMDSRYFQSFRDSAFHNKHQINILTSTTVYLPDILLAENSLCYFLEYMEQEGAGDLMQLWLVMDNFQQQLTLAKDGYDSEQAQNDAMVIYDKYFSLQATNPMGFDDKLRFLIEENICKEGGPLPDCFREAKVIVLKSLDKMYFSNYLQSQVYYRYLSDLLSTVQMAEDMHHKPKGHRRTGSDASSEHSLSSHQSASETSAPKARNTLLAVDTRKGKKSATSAVAATPAAAAAIEGDFSMTMDMFNPDDLWKRTSPGGMSLGSVDGLGQFVSSFEPDGTDKRKGAGGFLKRWKDKEKEQEDVALRIAQMIINDVNSMTQSSDSLGHLIEEEEEDKANVKDGR